MGLTLGVSIPKATTSVTFAIQTAAISLVRDLRTAAPNPNDRSIDDTNSARHALVALPSPRSNRR